MRITLKSVVSIFFIIIFVNSFGQGIQNEVNKFSRLLRLIDTYYVDSTNMEKLTEVAINNLLSELDPHSVYISKEDVEKSNEELVGSFDGIGISFNIINDTLIVGQTIPGGPSEKVGLQAGDRIITIDNESVAGVGLTNQMVFDRLRGVKGTLVTIKILRRGEAGVLEFEIIRDKIPIFSLDASYMVNNSTAYIKLNRFSATTASEFIEAISKLKANNKVENLILDLRGNGGGYLSAAHEISDQFLGAGKLVVYTEGLKNPKKDYIATYAGEFEKGKLVILIDGGSASASEIVSGAVQDWDRGVIIGRRSFGKGLVQQPYYLTDGSVVRLTTAHYYTPSGRCIQKAYENGVEDYRNDYSQRIAHGELFNKDSILVVDSLAYSTLINKRTVYGGGGIIPDVFIPIDTSSKYSYYNKLVRRNVVNQFVVSYVDSHRNEFERDYPTFRKFKSDFDVNNEILEKLWLAGDEKKIERDESSMSFIDKHAKRHLKSLIARSLWGASESYEILFQDDDELIKAVEILNDPEKYDKILKGILNE